jgi:hypothetical protein
MQIQRLLQCNQYGNINLPYTHKLCHRIQERTKQQFLRTRSFRMIHLKSLVQERLCIRTSMFRDRGTDFRAADLEDGLELGTIWERMSACHHFDDETA